MYKQAQGTYEHLSKTVSIESAVYCGVTSCLEAVLPVLCTEELVGEEKSGCQYGGEAGRDQDVAHQLHLALT
ncbi:MAG: hypothetical protein ACYCQJ_16395, partial [Nitrososphaerales archaeon]